MKILWHSAGPTHPTGYGQQTALWCRQIREQLGHDVAISAYAGIPGRATTFHGMHVYAPPFEVEAIPLTLRGNIERFEPDVTVGLFDAWRMESWPMRGYKSYMWCPVDTTTVPVGNATMGGMSAGDRKFFAESDVLPVALSRHGHRMMERAGIDAPLIPHGIDCTTFRPFGQAARAAARAELGIGAGTFAVGINASNLDPYRKAFTEQILAFARFHAKHPDSLLFINAMMHQPGSTHLGYFILACGLNDQVVRCTDQYTAFTTGLPQQQLVAWYNAMDVVMNATRGEGFGLPAVEAQACGTPVILSDNTTGPELCGPGWLVDCEPFWNMTHMSWNMTPSIPGLQRALEQAAAARVTPFKREAARVNAEKWDVPVILPLWEKLLANA